jgi:hypothetical protein
MQGHMTKRYHFVTRKGRKKLEIVKKHKEK